MRIDFLFAPNLPFLMRTGIAIAVMLVVVSVLYFTYRRLFRALPKKYAWVISTSKLLAGIVLLILIFRPVIHFSDSKSFDKSVLLLFDTSESMSIKDSLGNKQRLQASVEEVEKTGIIDEVKGNFDVKIYEFSSVEDLKEIESIDNLSNIIPGGNNSQIIQSSRKVSELAGSGNVGAIVVFTDGVENSPDIINDLRLNTKLFAVGVGSSPDENPFFQDISVEVEAPGKVISGNKTEFNITVKISGNELISKYKSLPITLKSDVETVEGIVEFEENTSIAKVTLNAKPVNVGKNKYTVSVPVDSTESITANNSKEIELSVSNPKIRILYVEGFPRYEYKGIVSVLGTDPNVDLTALINYGGGSYTAQGKTVKDVDLSKGLPLKLSDYENFDIVILGDLRPSDLSENQQELLKKWVIDGIQVKGERRQGNLLFLGGNDSLSGNWLTSPLSELLPVNLPGASSLFDSSKYIVDLTSEGMLNPVCKGFDQFFSESDKLKTFSKLNGFRRIKPSAESLITAKDQSGELYNVVVVQTVGGKVAVNGLTDTWKSWSFSPGGKGGRTLFTVFWGQLIRWLAGVKETEVEDKVSLILPEEKVEPGKSMNIKLIVKDDNGLYQENAIINSSVRTPENEENPLDFKSSGLPGQYIAKYQPMYIGKYRIQCSVKVEDSEIGTDSEVFIIGQELSEFYRIGIDRNYLKEISARNSGKYFNLMTVHKLPEALRNMFQEEQRIRNKDYTPNAFLFILFVLLLSVEWFVRRKIHII